MDAEERSEDCGETHDLQSRRSTHERGIGRRSFAADRRRTADGRMAARLCLDDGHGQILGLGPAQTTGRHLGVGGTRRRQLPDPNQRSVLAERHRDDAPTALSELRTTALRRDGLRDTDEDAALAVGKCGIEPRLRHGKTLLRRSLRQQPPPPDDDRRSNGRLRVRDAARDS